jgi:hypothetical protein
MVMVIMLPAARLDWIKLEKLKVKTLRDPLTVSVGVIDAVDVKLVEESLAVYEHPLVVFRVI